MDTVKLEIEIDKDVYERTKALCRSGKFDVSFSRHVEALLERNLDGWEELWEEAED